MEEIGGWDPQLDLDYYNHKERDEIEMRQDAAFEAAMDRFVHWMNSEGI